MHHDVDTFSSVRPAQESLFADVGWVVGISSQGFLVERSQELSKGSWKKSKKYEFYWSKPPGIESDRSDSSDIYAT